ncbi:RNA polymerase sigma-70 factor (ECF subfamily) [Hephaestia caeni]|uniref:RNA polymerase sigma-70 factor (ECF subfamily) n=1 Tax=Hephaestia caeni TaxID=645617 RepID=A0A397PKY3_9SPHN|nr:sigma-70 family RNA polymerase sigma factor [Hephaestia caeni]RIA46341.1 RNA polymerase sigma-70 factor (ECF subfamily) [Hephaestia caeni]
MALLISAYPDLKRRLAGRLGSVDLAQEALHDTYMRLRRTEIADEVRNPKSYLMSMALNIASNSARAERKHLSAAEVTLMIDLPDDAPDPLRHAEARSELAAVERALQKLPPRRRAIMKRVWIEGATYKELALEYTVSERTIRHEVLLATRHLHEATEVFSVEALQDQLSQVSSK